GSHIGVSDELQVVLSDQPRTLNLVDPGYYQQTSGAQPLSISAIASVSGVLGRTGDYAAYKLDLSNPIFSTGAELVVTPTPGSNVNLMFIDETLVNPEPGTVINA